MDILKAYKNINKRDRKCISTHFVFENYHVFRHLDPAVLTFVDDSTGNTHWKGTLNLVWDHPDPEDEFWKKWDEAEATERPIKDIPELKETA